MTLSINSQQITTIQHNLNQIANYASHSSRSLRVKKIDIDGFAPQFVIVTNNLARRIILAIASLFGYTGENNLKEIHSTVLLNLKLINQVSINDDFIHPQTQEVTELFIAAQKFNHQIDQSEREDLKPSFKLFREFENQGLSLSHVVKSSIPDLKPVHFHQIIKEDSFAKGPDVVKNRFYYNIHEHKNHYLEAIRIFFNTLRENIGSLFGIKSCQYFQHGETDADIYAHDMPSLHGDRLSSYWIGHATCVLNIPITANEDSEKSVHINLITDPVEGDLAKLLYERRTKAARGMHEAPKIDVFVLSHNHADHFDKETLLKLVDQQPIMIVPKGDLERFRKLGFLQVIEQNWWEKANIEFEQDGLTYAMSVCAVPANHWSGGGPCDGHKSSFLGYVISANGLDGDIYFAGDTARLSEEHIGILRNEFDIRWTFEPGGPDEVRKDMESTHQASVDALWMHFNLMMRSLYDRMTLDGQITKEEFLQKAYEYQTVFMHTKTFKLGNLHFDDTDRSVGVVLKALRSEDVRMKSYELQVFNDLIAIAANMPFSDGILSQDEIANLLEAQVTIPKIGSRTALLEPIQISSRVA